MKSCSNLSTIYSQYMLWSNITWYWTQYERTKAKNLFRLWTQISHPIPHPYGQAMGCLFQVLWRRGTTRYREYTVFINLCTALPRCCLNSWSGSRELGRGSYKLHAALQSNHQQCRGQGRGLWHYTAQHRNRTNQCFKQGKIIMSCIRYMETWYLPSRGMS